MADHPVDLLGPLPDAAGLGGQVDVLGAVEKRRALLGGPLGHARVGQDHQLADQELGVGSGLGQDDLHPRLVARLDQLQARAAWQARGRGASAGSLAMRAWASS